MLQKFQALFEKIATQVENNPTPFSRYIQLFFAILVVRLTLEFFPVIACLTWRISCI